MATTSTVAGVEVSLDHWIGGRRVSSSDRFENASPVDGSDLGAVAAGGKQEADMAVEAAREAFPAWAALGAEGRLPVLRKFAEGILARGKDIAAVETLDNGSLLAGNMHRMVPRAAQNISFFAEWALGLQDHAIDHAEVVNNVRYDPSGVAALITPWNAPMMLTICGRPIGCKRFVEGLAVGRLLPSVRPLSAAPSCGPVWEFADRNHITKACTWARGLALVLPIPSRRLFCHTLLRPTAPCRRL